MTDRPATRRGAPSKHRPTIADLQRQLDEANIKIRALEATNDAPPATADALASTDIDLASWLALAAARHPQLEGATEPLRWPAAARLELEGAISKYNSSDRAPCQERSRTEQLRLAAEIHELCEANGCGPDLADAIIIHHDGEWRRLYAPGVV